MLRASREERKGDGKEAKESKELKETQERVVLDPIPIPEDYLCPITTDLMEDPVVAADGHSYERSAISQWLTTGHNKSPLTGQRLAHTTLTPNHRLKAVIQDFKEKLPKIQKERETKIDLELQIKLREEFITALLAKPMSPTSEVERLKKELAEEKAKRQALEQRLRQIEAISKQLSVAVSTEASLDLATPAGFFTSYSPARERTPEEKADSKESKEAKELNEIEKLQTKAQAGDVDAQARLGRCYLFGNGVPKNREAATKWLTLVAKKTDLPAGLWAQGLCFEEGLGTAKNEKEAFACYQKAASKNYAPAQNELGLCYEYGTGVARDLREAVRYYRLAAAQGYANAQYKLGRCYEGGKGVAKDEREAVRYYRLSAEQGFAPAQCGLGLYYALGVGVAKDEREALRYYRLSADQGFAEAQNSLGLCYARGIGVAKDEREARKYYEMAAKQGNEDARRALDELGHPSASSRP